jgi:hypothetical protein
MKYSYNTSPEVIKDLDEKAYNIALSLGYDSIFKTNPIITGRDNTDMHVFVCEKHLLMAVWSIKSFYVYSGLNPVLYVYDDGSLSNMSKNIIGVNFLGSILVDKNIREHTVLSYINNYPYCSRVRNASFYNTKLFDAQFFSKNEYMLFVDTDVLMFKESQPLIDRVKNKYPFYVGGGYGFLKYIRDIRYIEKMLGIIPAGNVNAGFYGRCSGSTFFNLDFIEKSIEILINSPETFEYLGKTFPTLDPRYTSCYSWYEFEQVLLSFLFGRDPNTKVIWAGLPPDWAPSHCKYEYDLHQYPNIPLNKLTSICHYSYEFKHRFFSEGVKYLIDNNFLKDLEVFCQKY